MSKIYFFAFVILFNAASKASDNLDTVYPSISGPRGETFSYADFLEEEVYIKLFPEFNSAKTVATVKFQVAERGFPIFLWEQKSTIETEITLNGEVLNESDYSEVSEEYIKYPGNIKPIVIHRALDPNKHHVLKFKEGHLAGVIYDEMSVRWAPNICDNCRGGEKHYFEKYFPSGFHFDQYTLVLDIKVIPPQGVERFKRPYFFSNGSTKTLEDLHWRTVFPNFFTSSSFLIEISSAEFRRAGVIHGLQSNIPVTLGPGVPDKCYDHIKTAVDKLEPLFGPFPHKSIGVALRHFGYSSNIYAMEFPGGFVITDPSNCEHPGSYWIVEHEIAHNWFARSVMPRSWGSEWVDEEIAYWIHSGMGVGEELSSSKVGESLAMLFKEKGGLVPVLRALHESYSHRTISSAEFRKFVSCKAGDNSVDNYFKDYLGLSPPTHLSCDDVE